MSIRSLCSKALLNWPARRKRSGEWLKAFPRAYRSYKRPPAAIGMTTDKELCFLETYARENFTGKGTIVDLGCWLGATTISLARGLENNPKITKQPWIDAIDRFVWIKQMVPVAAQIGLTHSFQPGEDFRDWVRQRLGRYQAWVNLKKLDLLSAPDEEGAIEFLFVDAMKTWPLATRITHNYLPRLLPGESYLVQQDFAFHHPSAAPNHLIMWFLRDHFKWLYHVPRSGSVAYRCTRAVVAADLPEFTESFFTLNDVNEAYDYSVQCVSPDVQYHVRLCKLCFLLERGWDEAAAAEAESMAKDAIRLAPHIMTDVIACLRTRRLDQAADRHSLTKTEAAINTLESET